MKQLKVGDTLHYYTSTPIGGVVGHSEYKIIGETPKFWKVENSNKIFMCSKDSLKIRGEYRILQRDRDEKLDKKIRMQELIKEIDRKTEVIIKNKRDFLNNGDIEAFEKILNALNDGIRGVEDGKN